MKERELREEKKKKTEQNKRQKYVTMGSKIPELENPGIDPSTSRMLSGHSTIWANSPIDIKIETPVSVIDLGIDLKCSSSIFFSEQRSLSFTLYLL